MLVADNVAAVVGGRNLADEYFGAAADVNFADLDLLMAGPVVRELSVSFDEYWNSNWAVPARSKPQSHRAASAAPARSHSIRAGHHVGLFHPGR
jgi:putative cardiolipin synthase